MTLNLDGFAVLAVIAANPHLFSDVTSDAAKVARNLVIKELKSGEPDLLRLREVRKALGRSNFLMVLEAMTDPEVKSLATKYDKHRQEIKASDAAWRRAHLSDLADGRVDAAIKPPPKPRAKAKPKAKAAKPRVLDLESMRQPRGRRK